MIPVTLAIIGIRQDKSVKKNLVAVLFLVLGMAVMYSLLGVMAAALGKSFGFLFQNVVFLIFLDLIFLLMSLSLLGLFDIQLPVTWQSALAKISASGYRGIFFIGLTMGLLAAPCVGPVVGPILIYVAQTQSLFKGFFLLLSYALGMGLIFFIVGGFYGVLKIKLRSGGWTFWFKKALGVLMILVTFYYGQTIYAQFIKPNSNQTLWRTDVKTALEEAKMEGRPVLLDFFAQWCLPCKELDQEVWSRPQIKQNLSDKWVAVKIDCTSETPECKAAVSQFGVVGWPTVIFLDKNQSEVKSERLIGKVITADEMEDVLKRVEGPQK
jgi:thiol:disulfide interchange protein DsbD